jgi:transglutaminase-like putative cysteine protease
VLFLLFPRIQGPLWGMPADGMSSRSGMSDKMSPGNISNLALSEEIVFRALFTAEPPPKPALYWRGPVLGTFDGRIWSPLQQRFDRRRQIDLDFRGEPLRYQVTLEPTGRNWLFLLEAPQAMPVLTGNVAGVGPDLDVRTASPINERIRFDAISSIDFALQPNENPIVLRQWLNLPPGFNPRAMEFAQNLRATSDNPRDLVNAVLRFFRTEKFSYTLQPPTLGRHTVDEFLFDTRAGFCEHYSSAFVVLMRAMDIPARVVTGYQGGEINPADGYMTVRQSDAHAWAEVWLPDQGWTRVDPTSAVAPNRIEMNLGSVIPRRMFGGLLTLDGKRAAWLAGLQSFRQNWDALTNTWNQWVLNYTPQQQKNFVQSLGFKEVDWRTLTLLMISVGGVIMAIIVIPLIMNRSHLDPVEAVYRKLCERLARQGHVRLAHEGPRTYRRRLTAPDSPLHPKQKEAVARFLDYYETARYSATGSSSAAVLSQLKSLYAQCR